MSKVNSTSAQIYPKLYANQQMLPIVQHNKSFDYLGRYFNYLSAKDALNEIRKDKIGNMVTNFTSQSLVIKAMWEEAFAENVKHWQSSISSLPENIYNFTTRYPNNTLPTLKNMTL